MGKPAFDWKLLAELVSTDREASKLGVRDYARAVGVSPATINRIENRKHCSVGVLVRVLTPLRWKFEDFVS